MGKVVSVSNQKGGVGKTTTAVNLAACLGHLNVKTLLIDLDPQANATSGLGIDKLTLQKTIYHAIVQHLPIREAVISTSFHALDLIPSIQDLTGAEIELLEIEDRNKVLTHLLPDIKDKYDCIIIDCPPSLNILTINALSASDLIFIPIQCEYYALEGLTQLLKTVDLVKENINPRLNIAGILFTMADLRTNLTRQVMDEVRKFFPDRAYQTIIPRSVRLSESPSFGKPILYYDEKSVATESYLQLAREFIKRNLVVGPQPILAENVPGQI